MQLAVQGKLTKQWRLDNPDVDIDLIELEELRESYQLQASKKRKQKSFRYRKSVDIDVGGKSKGVEALFDLPSNWKWVSLGQLSWSINDGPHFSPSYVDNGIPILSTRNVSFEDGLDFSSAKYVSLEDHTEFTKRGVPSIGDIILTKGGTTGIPCVIETSEKFSIWVHLALIKLIKEFVSPYYLRFSLASPFVYKQSKAQTHGIGNQDLGLTRMIYFAIPLPPLNEQKAIVQTVNQLMDYCDQMKSAIANRNTLSKDFLRSSIREVMEKTKSLA